MLDCQGVVPGAVPLPPVSNTGEEITVHWARGGFAQSEEAVLELVNDLTGGGYCESHDWGRYLYRRHHLFVGGLAVYCDPRVPNMPAVMVDAPGEACEVLGFERLQTLFCNAELSRVDVAFDGAPFSPRDVAGWIRARNIRTRAQRRGYYDDLTGRGGDTVVIGSRSSEQMVRVYDKRGFTRVELELKGDMARGFKGVLLSSPEVFVSQAVGVLRQFLDFVDASASSNISRAPLLAAWAVFTQSLERVRLRVTGVVVDTLEDVADWLEHQVSAMLYTYHRAGRSVGKLLQLGRGRMRQRHRSILARAGVT